MLVPTDQELIAEALAHMRRLWISAKDAKARGDHAETERIYREWMRLAPWDWRPRWGLSELLLLDGRYEEGFALYEARREIPAWIRQQTIDTRAKPP